ncbi:NAD(P)-binding domain-containing protein [Desulfovibrio aminophilus]|uniref:NAD(P)-dependent oxidoreductase n=1 Tax=Desulfovibrio aminophilus TaxID=81425 RepID=UPI00339B846D
MDVGFIGLGVMGKPMALNLIKAGHSLTVYDIMKEAVADLTRAGAKAADSPKEVASAVEAVITMLPNAAIVDATLNGESGLLAGAKPGQVFVDMSSVAPHTSIKMAGLAAAKGVGYVDAPVSGGASGAVAGTLTIMVGGAAADVKKVLPLFEAMGKNVRRMGETGSGDAVKMVNNLLLGANMAALSEALVLGVKSGLSAETMLDVIRNSSGASYALTAKMPNFIMKRKFAPGFTVDLQYKDLELAVESAKAMALPLPMTNAAQQVFELARANGLGREDISSVVKVWERLAGVVVQASAEG